MFDVYKFLPFSFQLKICLKCVDEEIAFNSFNTMNTVQSLMHQLSVYPICDTSRSLSFPPACGPADLQRMACFNTYTAAGVSRRHPKFHEICQKMSNSGIS